MSHCHLSHVCSMCFHFPAETITLFPWRSRKVFMFTGKFRDQFTFEYLLLALLPARHRIKIIGSDDDAT